MNEASLYCMGKMAYSYVNGLVHISTSQPRTTWCLHPEQSPSSLMVTRNTRVNKLAFLRRSNLPSTYTSCLLFPFTTDFYIQRCSVLRTLHAQHQVSVLRLRR